MACMVFEKKHGKVYVETYRTGNECEVYRKLASDLVAKKLNGCLYIKSIRREQRYTHSEVIVTYDNGCRSIYKLDAHF